MSRRVLVTVSVAAHVAIAFAFFVASIWKIERLDKDRRFLGSISVALPPPAPSGGMEAAAPVKMPPRKPPPTKPPVLVQPVEHPPETPAVAVATTTGGGGSGDTTGPGTGPGPADATGTCNDPAVCGEGSGKHEAECGDGRLDVSLEEECDDGNTRDGDGCSSTCKKERVAQLVPPTVLAGLRISGDTQVHPPDVVKTQILREGRERVVGVLKVCVGTEGQVTSAGIASSTRYDAYDRELLDAARGWRYRPYSVDGHPIAVCGMVTFIYAIK